MLYFSEKEVGSFNYTLISVKIHVLPIVVGPSHVF